MAVLDWEPVALEEVIELSGLSMPVAALALEDLSRLGLVRGDAGWWTRC